MTYGPVDFVTLKFQGNKFKGKIFPEILSLVNQVTGKDVLGVFDPIKTQINGMIQLEDIEMIGKKASSWLMRRDASHCGLLTLYGKGHLNLQNGLLFL